MTGEEDKITISLTEKEAELFKLFRKHQDDFKTLIENKVFSFHHGNAIIHKNEGIIMQININEIPFKRKKE